MTISENPEIITFGCRLNACESETITRVVYEMGLKNYIIINTCAVTQEAERQVKQKIRQINIKHPHKKIILTGCASQLNPSIYANMPGVVAIIDNQKKLLHTSYEKFNKFENSINYKESNNKIRAFLQIQNGCDHDCTYCIVKQTRGQSVSFDPNKITKKTEELVNIGYKEIVFTGVNISSYNFNGIDLVDLSTIFLKKFPQLRVRFSSIDPADINQKFIDFFANTVEIMPHLHLSIQSGDNHVLEKMHRRHTREHVLEICKAIINLRKDVIFGADFIAGFPTETENMLDNTASLIVEAEISLAHIFPFSPRTGTQAAEITPQLSNNIKRLRAKRLREESSSILQKKLQKYVGAEINGIAESKNSARSDNFLHMKCAKELEVGKTYKFLCKSVSDNTNLDVDVA